MEDLFADIRKDFVGFRKDSELGLLSLQEEPTLASLVFQQFQQITFTFVTLCFYVTFFLPLQWETQELIL